MTHSSNGLAGDWAVISQSNHDVFTDGVDWLKVAYDTSPKARHLIWNEIEIFDAIGIDVRQVEYDGRLGHVTPYLGEPVDPQRFDVDSVLALMDRLWATVPEEAVDLPRAFELGEIVKRRVETRVDDLDYRNELISRIPRSIPYDLEAPVGLCHTDLHAGNILTAGDGFVIIDWESAMYGPRAIYRASLMYSLWLSGRRSDALRIGARTPEAQHFVMAKAISAASWAYSHFGRDAADVRLQAGMSLLEALVSHE